VPSIRVCLIRRKTQTAIRPLSLESAIVTLAETYRRLRLRTDGLFSLVSGEAFWCRPIRLRHPIVFYRGHLAAFDVNTLGRRALGWNGIRPDFEVTFERGIDPADEAQASRVSIQAWPPRAEIEDYVAEVDRRVGTALTDIDEEHPAFEAAQICIEHELMHQETLLYIFHRLPLSEKRRPEGYVPETSGEIPSRRFVPIPAGPSALGSRRGAIPFGWDNEFPETRVDVASFEIGRDNVTNADYLEFVHAGGYDEADLWQPDDWRWRRQQGLGHPLFWEQRGGEWRWRGMFDDLPLPLSWPVYVSLAEARAYARFRRCRLPTEAEYQRAAYGGSEAETRSFPWGDGAPSSDRGNFNFSSFDPVPAGSRAAGASAFGVRDLAGNGWEWTSTAWSGFPGFAPSPLYPGYSSDFFDGNHFTMKGASPATDVKLLRPSFRNWFQPHYPYPYAAFRLVGVPK
jgi:iron(II)-dependent oxidoreductase